MVFSDNIDMYIFIIYDSGHFECFDYENGITKH